MKLIAPVLLLLLVGCSAPAPAPAVVETTPTVAATPSPTPTPTPEPTEDYEPDPPTKADFAVKLKITGKECFGSAGCNVTVKATITYVGIEDLEDLPSLIDVTYRIKGAEDEYTATIEMEDGKYSPDVATLSTKRSKDKLTASITNVETY